MTNVFSLKVTDDETGEQFVTVFVAGAGEPRTASSATHPNYAKIVELADAGDTAVLDLFDVGAAVAERFEALTDRISVANGHVYLDGDEVHSVLTKQILRFMEEDEDFWPLVYFFDHILSNPNEHSREQLFEWLDRRDFTIDSGGYLLAYKGVKLDDEGKPVSVNAGPGIVNGEPVHGHLSNEVGNLVEIARSAVKSDPSVGCASGLHVGTYDYARGWARGALLLVRVNPRDVVSVPTDCDAAKVRCCRYEVLEVIDAPETAALRSSQPVGDVYSDDDEYVCCEMCAEDDAGCDCEYF